MKTTYYLVTGTAVAVAALVVYAQLPNLNGPLPPAANTANAAPPADVPRLALPPISTPPDEPLVMPAVKPNELPPLPSVPETQPVKPLVPPTATPAGYTEPVVPPALPGLPDPVAVVPSVPPVVPELPAPSFPVIPPTVPAPPGGVDVPVVPPVPPPSLTPPKPVPVETPAFPPARPNAPVEPLIPAPRPNPALEPPAKPLPAPTPVLQPPVQPTPAPLAPAVSGDNTLQSEALPGTKYIVLKDDKIIEGAVTLRGDAVVVRQGSLDRPFGKGQVQFVGDSKDDVYRFQLAKVQQTDISGRLKVARWCMFSGLREQALVEAREVQKLQPTNADAAGLVRSLEQSLRQFPPADAPKMTPPQTPTFPVVEPKMTAPTVPTVPAELSNRPALPTMPAVNEADPDLNPDAVKLFATKVQPILANQCVECHAKPDFAGKFKLVRVDPATATQKATRTNLWAVAAQLRRDEPGASPLLVKSLQAHGGQKIASLASRQAPAYQMLEAWTSLAIGTPVAAAPAVPVVPAPSPAVPVLPPVAAPTVDPTPVLPPTASPTLPPAVPVVPPMPAAPVVPLPAADPVSLPPVPSPSLPPLPVTPPPTPATPTLPSLPSVPPALPGSPAPAPVRPSVPAGPSALPAPPMIPVADPLVPGVPVPPKPTAPPIPPASGFGEAIPPKAPVTGPAGDEFDPAGFNQGMPKK